MEDRRARFGDVAWAQPILRQIARGLAELHANRIVHRDLKPGNVLLVERGGVAPVAKISDFGISRLDDRPLELGSGAAESGHLREVSPRDLTEAGALLGTPVYMAPEALFEPAQRSSADLFSFGVLAYEALSGRAPFAVPAVLLVRKRQPIPDPAPLEGVGDEVTKLLLACLRAEPSERPTADRVASALGRG
jgi:serine/threonine-protein kinase